ncbi:efflux RND transporter permease subunit [Rubrobacter indicoceani]|uniref:efflux RND transporter permease subunit n=1 Tax=Rubrobacter indicoceani TaxID=2051957 RepID=UPI000E5ADE98|nr:efflux RND transporter permease subunit [Rubrobacter indicoceani]
MKSIVRWCLGNKSIVILATVLLVVSGAYAATQLNEELLPDIEFPLITVTTIVPGAGPEVVDEQVTQDLESAVEGVEGIESLRATSGQGFSSLLVEFSLDTDTQEALDDVNRALADVALPDQAEDPQVQSQGITAIPVLSTSISAADGDLESLTRYVQDEVVPEIEEVDGVASADLVGGSESQFRVDLDLDALAENGLPPEAVVAAINGANTNSPVGSVKIDGLDTSVRTTSTVTDAEALRDLPVSATSLAGAAGAPGAEETPPEGSIPEGGAASPSGAPAEPVALGELAEVSESSGNLAGISRSNGEPSLSLNIVKERDSNTVEVARGVEAVLDGVRDELGRDQVSIIFNSADDVEESVDGLVEKALLGGALAVLVIFFFLRSLRATLVTAISLPTSILAALLFSWAQDLTLNIITLAGLTIAVGRVVDDAIVVLENSYRYVQRGYEPEEAALRGTTEVASAITSSTLTTIAVFLPLGLVGGIVSEFFLPLSLTVALALLASLVVALTVIPVLISLFISRRVARDPEGARSGSLSSPRRVGTGLRVLVGGAVLLLVSVACAAVAVLVGAVAPEDLLGSTTVLVGAAVLAAVLAAGLIVFLLGAIRSEDRSTSSEPREASEGGVLSAYTGMLWWSLRNRALVVVFAVAAFAGGLAVIPFLSVSFFPPSEENLLSAQVETRSGNGVAQTAAELEPLEDFLLDDADVASYQLSVGGEDPFSSSGSVRPENEAQSFIAIHEDADVNAALERIRDRGDRLYGEDFQVQVLSQGPQTGGLEVSVTGGSEGELRESAATVVEELRGVDGLANVRSDIASETPEITVSVNRDDAAAAGVSPASLAATLGTLLGGSTLDLDGTPVVVGIPESEANTVAAIEDLPTGTGATVGEVATVEERNAPAAIGRADGERAVTVSGTITATDTNAVSAEVESALEELELTGGVTASVGGESEDIAQSFRDLLLSIVIALVIVYLVLVLFFRSLVVPLVILLAVPLTTVGAFGALLVTGTTLSVPSLLGVLLLIGIVVANAILLVDFVINAGRESATLDEAIVEAGRARLRPILMTALATIFALVPLALGLGGGGNVLISSSLAIPVIGGLITSTLLTLIVVPVGYSLLREPRRKHRPEPPVGEYRREDAGNETLPYKTEPENGRGERQ